MGCGTVLNRSNESKCFTSINVLNSDQCRHIHLQIPEIEGGLGGRPISRVGYSSGTECSRHPTVCGQLGAGKPGTSGCRSTHTPP